VAEEQTGFEITSHHTMFSGLCPACAAKQRRAGRTQREKTAAS
jgi:Fe2+ or Zn2+ uptake regulation protein